jgi:hypothetical protein
MGFISWGCILWSTLAFVIGTFVGALMCQSWWKDTIEEYGRRADLGMGVRGRVYMVVPVEIFEALTANLPEDAVVRVRDIMEERQ